MSHFIRLQTRITDMEQLKQVLYELGYKYEVGPTEIYAGSRRKETVDLAIADDFKLGTDIGFQKVGDRIELITDVQKLKVRDFPNQVMQRYAYNVVRMKLESEGFRIDQEQKEDSGQLHLVLRRMA